MKVLLLLTDLFKNIGGGQTVYRKVVENSPDVEFYYFRVDEAVNAPRPKNARAIPLLGRRNLVISSPMPHPEHLFGAVAEADMFARSVAGRSFDIVELPDFMTCGAYLKSALAHHGVVVGRTVLSLHGNISTSIDLNWSSAGNRVFELQQLERLQFDAADGVYGISKRYIHQWQALLPREVAFIDPAHFVDMPGHTLALDGDDILPSLYSIGRSERLKGNDLFVELVRWLNPSLFGKAQHIGGIDRTGGVSSAVRLHHFADARQSLVPHRGAMNHKELMQLYRQKSMVVLPVRFDTLNLVALEALFSGCPVAVSTKAGVCDYLDEYHPNLPYTKIDLERFYEAVPALEDVLTNYDAHRARLNEALSLHPPKPKAPLDMKAEYSAFIDQPVRKPRLTYGFATMGEHVAYETNDPTVAPRPDLARQAILQDGFGIDPHVEAMVQSANDIFHALGEAGRFAERNSDALADKLSFLYSVAPHVVLRGNFWMEIARVERLRGNDHMAATYELRLLRALGEDRFGLLPRVLQTMKNRKADGEADAASALYGDPATAEERVYKLLADRREGLLTYTERPLAITDDRRTQAAPKLSVIVSLYNAADKLWAFLSMLRQQTLFRRNLVEVILVDSGSPSDERSVFEAFHAAHPFDAIYVRSADRETIQAAWNRGIKLARAPYLAFLGVDEAVFPEAFDVLVETLDNNPKLDWVQGNSIVTDVDDFGLHKNDVMPYNRQEGTWGHPILDTCYLTFVGGIYRRNVHDRFGYFDENFRGAGDTEFKNRILSKIGVGFVDCRLGLFMNYADGQTTSSPMAELEDSRAWYLFRTEGGVRYLLDERPIEDAEALLVQCLGYKKSYCGHKSTDFDLGVVVADYILKRKPSSAIARFLYSDLLALRESLRSLEIADHKIPPETIQLRIYHAWHQCRLMQVRHGAGLAKLGVKAEPTYLITNDNRYEQHSWLWKSL